MKPLFYNIVIKLVSDLMLKDCEVNGYSSSLDIKNKLRLIFPNLQITQTEVSQLLEEVMNATHLFDRKLVTQSNIQYYQYYYKKRTELKVNRYKLAEVLEEYSKKPDEITIVFQKSDKSICKMSCTIGTMTPMGTRQVFENGQIKRIYPNRLLQVITSDTEYSL